MLNGEVIWQASDSTLSKKLHLHLLIFSQNDAQNYFLLKCEKNIFLLIRGDFNANLWVHTWNEEKMETLFFKFKFRNHVYDSLPHLSTLDSPCLLPYS